MSKSYAHILLLLSFWVFLPSTGLSQDLPGMAKRAKRFIQYLDDHHLRPRTIDDDFGKDVHTRLIDFLDRDRLLFHVEDITTLRAAADSLDDDIYRKRTHYASAIIEIYKKRLKEATEYVHAFLDGTVDVYGTESEFDREYTSFSKSKTECQKRWEIAVLGTAQQYVLTELDLEKPLDKKSVNEMAAEALKNTREFYDRYLESLGQLDNYFELGYINAIAQAYDPHSSYFNAELREEFTDELSSSQYVFGITYGKTIEGEVEITEILPGSSAWYAEEVNEGDVILSITSADGQYVNTKHEEIENLSTFFATLTTDTIYLELKTEEGSKDVELVRSNVYSDNDIIKSAMLKGDKNIGYISLPDFYSNWTDTNMLGCANDVAKSLLKLKKNDMDGLILDLRNNGGGSLVEAVDLVGIFINYGPVILAEDAAGEVVSLKDFNKGSIYRGPLIVLVNSESASASEIVAGTLQDYNRALILGQQSFGKATGQGMYPLDPKMETFMAGVIDEDPSWGYVKSTDIGLYRLRKSSAQQKGITPDIVTPHISAYEQEYERDLPHSIVLDSVVKKIYYTPRPSPPIAELNAWYAQQPKDKIQPLIDIMKEIRARDKELSESISLEKTLRLYQTIDTLSERYQDTLSTHEFAYEAESFQFTETLLRMSPLLGTYNTEFLERLSRDIELNEAYKIMKKLIEMSGE